MIRAMCILVGVKNVQGSEFHFRGFNMLRKLTIFMGIIVFIVAGAFFIISDTGDLEPIRIDDKIESNCVEQRIFYNVTIPIYGPKIKLPNVSYEFTEKDIIGYRNETVNYTVVVCKPYAMIDNKVIDFQKQGYNCSFNGGIFICDSCSDGNCDGVCDQNGGETCCKVFDGKTICKNSMTEWVETDIHTKALSLVETSKPSIDAEVIR